MKARYKCISKYIFEQLETASSTYILKELHGFELPNFLSTDKTGKQNVRFAPPDKNKPGQKRFDKIMCGKGRITGITFSSSVPEKTYGDTRNPTMKGNDCLLLEFSDNNKYLTILVVKDMAKKSFDVWQEWLNGEVLEVVDSERMPVNKKAVSRKD